MKTSTLAIAVIAAMLVAGIGIYWWNTNALATKPVPVVKEGDKVSVWYYGYIYYGGERRIFDTNIEKVAKDNITYPKTVSYKWSPHFFLLNFTVGDHTMIEGFEKGVIGMKKGETKTIIVPPDEGYKFYWSKVKNYSYEREIPVIENLTLEQFQKRYGAQSPLDNSVYRDRYYGWLSTVLYVNPIADVVTVMHDARAGETYIPFTSSPDFKVKVLSISNGMIKIRYIIEKTPILLPDGGIIDYTNSTGFRINYNQEVAGKTLYFVVTVVDIKES